MSFPADPLKIITELYYDDQWNDITPDVFNRDPVFISRGRANEGVAVDPGSCSLTLNNGVSNISGIRGRYSPRNPRSDLYGKFGRGTQLRVSVMEGAAFFDNADGSVDTASTPDAAALDITGDIDLRWEGEINWHAEGAQMLIGKWGEAGNRSYHMRVENSRLYIHTTQDGTVGRVVSVSLPLNMPKHAAVRGTMITDDGAGGNKAELYWAETIAGPWRSLGSLVGTGTLSIFVSTAPLTIAPQQTDSGITVPRFPFVGRCSRAEVRHGIDGVRVANADFDNREPGTTAFVDSSGRAWTMKPDGITNRHVRFAGEVAEWPIRWNEDGSDCYVTLVASGILRRMSQGQKALNSSLRRRIPTFEPLAYWPMESGTDATESVNLGKQGGTPLTLAPATWAADDSLPSSGPLPTLRSTVSGIPCQMHGGVAAPDAALSAWSVQYLYKNDNPNTTVNTYLRILSTGTVGSWYLQQSNGISRVIGKDDEDVEIYRHDIATGSDLYNQWVRVEFRVIQEGSNIRWLLQWTDVGGDAGQFNTIFPGTIGRPVAVASPPDGYSGNLDGMSLGHISVWGVEHSQAYNNAVDAWAGERAGARMRRLAAEESAPIVVVDNPAGHSQVGPQYPESLLTTVQDAADADGGILSEQRDEVALRYRGRINFYNQPPGLLLDFDKRGLVTPVEPTDDDQNLRNDRTVERREGASAQAVLETGPLSTADVGIYDDSTTLNLFTDAQVDQTAWWLLRQGTVDEARYPSIMINLAVAPHLIKDAADIEVGDRLQVANPPEWLPPGLIDQRVEGYQETLSITQWFIEYNCSPHSVWNTGQVDGEPDSLNGGELSRADTAGSLLADALTDTEQVMTVRTYQGPVWTPHQSDYPFDLRVGGEVVRALSPQALMNANPFFADTVSDWTPIGSTLARDTTFVHPAPHAVASMKVTPTTFGGATGALSPAPGIAVSPGSTYTTGVWVYAPNGIADFRIRASWYTSASAFISTAGSTANVIPAARWTFVEQDQIAPANAAFARVHPSVFSSTASDVAYLWAARITLPTAGFLDTFSRTVSNGWGTSDTGNTWTEATGSAANYSVSGGFGRHTHGATSGVCLSLIPSPAADVDLVADISATQDPAGAALVGAFVIRAPNDANWYGAGVTLNPGGSVGISLSKRVNNNSGIILASTTLPDTFTAGVFIRFRVQIFGSTLRLKGWTVGNAEPDWQLTHTDTQFKDAANLGLRTFRATGNTNTGVDILLDNFQLLDTQTFVVERSINDVVKAHESGVDVRLAHPTIVAL